MPKRKTEAQRYPFKFAAKGSALDAAAKAVMEADGQWPSTPWNKIDRIDRIWYTRLAQAALDAKTEWVRDVMMKAAQHMAKKSAKRSKKR